MRFEFSFRCPRCGSSHFGSSQTPDGWLRCCHGANCRYQAPEAEDWKHFVLVGEFGTEQEYREAHGKVRAEASQYVVGQVDP